MSCFKTVSHKADFCVVGGGLSGLCAAVSAARHGVNTVLVQDRPMLGGNASSEVRMWVCGAGGDNNRETGIIKELFLENDYRNPQKNYSVWDSVMFGLAKSTKNLTVLLNCSCMDGKAENGRLHEILCWQLTTQKFHSVKAKIFADCSGDSVLAPITGAPYMRGREAAGEYGERLAPEKGDGCVMGMSCIIQAREEDREIVYTPPEWAMKLTDEDFSKHCPYNYNPGENYWYLELGGRKDTIGDTEEIRDELIRLAYGVWDYVKNSPSQREKNKNFSLEWVGILPGKRESRRYKGAYILTESDIEAGGHFVDITAYGGWTLDAHNPDGFFSEGQITPHGRAPSPFGIPYRCFYSQTVENLMFAGRNISATHMGISATRVMATCAVIGQAVGTAAAIAVKKGIMPPDIYPKHTGELQFALMWDDCFLPFLRMPIPEVNATARLVSDMENAGSLRNGYDRPCCGEGNAAAGSRGCFAMYEWEQPVDIEEIRLIFDSDLNRLTAPEAERRLNRNMYHNIIKSRPDSRVPPTLVRDFDIVITGSDGEETTTAVRRNYQRHVAVKVGKKALSVRVVFLETWGAEQVSVFSFNVR